MAKSLLRAESKTRIGDYWNIPTLIDHIVNEEVFAFQQTESDVFGVMHFSFSPLAKTLNVFWLGKDSDNPTPPDWDEVLAFLEYTAKNNGCRFVQCECRPGWKAILEPRGYSVDSVLFTKEVLYESPPV